MSSEIKDMPKGKTVAAETVAGGGPAERGRLNISVAVVVAIVICLVAAAAVYKTNKSRASLAEEEQVAQPVVSVNVAVAQRKTIDETISSVGTIYPRQKAEVSANISAQIIRMDSVVNKHFNAGDVVAELNAKDIMAQRNEANAQLDEARLELKNIITGDIPQAKAQNQKEIDDARAASDAARSAYDQRKALFDQGGISKRDIETSHLAVVNAENELKLAEKTLELRATATDANDKQRAEARIAQARERVAALDTQLSYAKVRAPISGVVTEQAQFRGEYASAGGKLFTIADMSEVIVKAPFADTVAAQLKIGDPVMVYPDEYPNMKLTGTVSLISRQSDSQSRSVEVWINIKNADGLLRSNGAAKVLVSANAARDAIVVPTAAVTLDATNSDTGSIMTVDSNSIAHEKKVKIGMRYENSLQVMSGLNPGETIIVEGNYALQEGVKVKVLNSAAARAK